MFPWVYSDPLHTSLAQRDIHAQLVNLAVRHFQLQYGRHIWVRGESNGGDKHEERARALLNRTRTGHIGEAAGKLLTEHSADELS